MVSFATSDAAAGVLFSAFPEDLPPIHIDTSTTEVEREMNITEEHCE